MRKILQYMILLWVSWIVFSLGGCTSDDTPSPVDASGIGKKVNLTLNVSIGNTTGMRPTRDGENDNFSFDQTTIDFEKIKTLRVIIVRPDYTVEFNRLINLTINTTGVTTLTNKVLTEDGQAGDQLNFLVSTDQGHVDNEQQTCTERKRIYLIANEESLNSLSSNFTGDGQKISDLLNGFTPAYYPTEEEEKEGAVGNRGDKLDPSVAQRWIIYNNWEEGATGAGLYASPIIDNTGASKNYIPMTEFFDIDVVSSWEQEEAENEEEETEKVTPQKYSQQTANLFITRNFVKFIFSTSSEDETFDVKGIRFENLSQKEYLFPCNTVYSPEKAISENEKVEDRQIVSFTTPGAAGNLRRPYLFTPSEFKVTKPAEGEEPVTAIYAPEFYFCETNNYETDDKGTSVYNVSLDLRYYNTNGSTTDISFKNVQLPNLPYSLPRNTIVKVHFTIHERYYIEASVTVLPYTSVSLNPEFGFAAPVSDQLTVAPTMELEMGVKGLLYATFTSRVGTTIDKLYWVSSDPSIVLLEPKDNTYEDPNDLRYVKPSDSIELPYNQETKEEPVGVLPQKPGETYITVYSQTGKVARCKVTVK